MVIFLKHFFKTFSFEGTHLSLGLSWEGGRNNNTTARCFIVCHLMVQSGVSLIGSDNVASQDDTILDVLSRWSRRSWRFSIQILQHFSDCVWPQLSSHLLCWSCGQHACLHLGICCVTDSEKAVLWCASCQPGNEHCICITGSEQAPACSEKQWWWSIWRYSKSSQRSRWFGSTHWDGHMLSMC